MKRRDILIAFIALCVVAAAVVWYAFSKRVTRPFNVVLISIDTVRADHLGCYGYDVETSPNMDRLAEEAVLFTEALSQSSWTLPSHMSIMTSQYPSVHGVGPARRALAASTPTLAEVLSKSGFETAGFVSWVFLGSQWGFAQGFDTFRELWGAPMTADNPAGGAFTADVVTDAAVEWVRGEHAGPFFLFVHYFDPHMNYEPPPPYDTMFDPAYEGAASGEWSRLKQYIKWMNENPESISERDLEHVIALYDGEIRYVDEHVGRLMNALDGEVGLENCLVVLTSDHGEEFNDHGSMEGHGWTLYNEVLRVPLMVRMPGRLSRAAVVDSTVALIDLAPTILELVKAPAPESFQGRSLRDLLRGGGRDSDDKYTFAETYRFNRKRSVRGRRYKLIHTEDTGVGKGGVRWKENWELFDLLRDPNELTNLYSEGSPVAEVLARRLELFREKETDASRRGDPVEISEENLELLRSLGYVE